MESQLQRGVCFPLPPAGKAPACGSFMHVNRGPGPWQMCSGFGCTEIAIPQSAPPFHCLAPGFLSNASFCAAANCFQLQQSSFLALHKVQALWP